MVYESSIFEVLKFDIDAIAHLRGPGLGVLPEVIKLSRSLVIALHNNYIWFNNSS